MSGKFTDRMRWTRKDPFWGGKDCGSQMLQTLQEVPLRQPPAPPTESGGIQVEDPAQVRLAQLPPFSAAATLTTRI